MRRKHLSLRGLFRSSKRNQDIYQYKPLVFHDSIRLLELHPASSPTAPIKCDLNEFEFSGNTRYEALSYVWGSDETPEILHLVSGYLRITENLAAALRGLRHVKKPRFLWVDAVCIDQANDTEKSSQVAKMAVVYQNASVVLAWLGEDLKTSPVDTLAIMNISQKAKEIGLGGSLTGQRDIFLAWLRQEVTPPTAFQQAIDFLQAVERANFPLIYCHEWFTRMWIVQEALLANSLTLYRGSNSLPWEDFQRVMIVLNTIRDGIHLPMPNSEFFIKHSWNLIVVRDHYCSPERGDRALDFAYYAAQLRRRDCKNDRDRVYALRSLLPMSSELTLIPDYKKTVVEVFTDLARLQLGQGHIDILYQAGLCRNLAACFGDLFPHAVTRPDPVPSWVPDYRKESSYVGWAPYFGDATSFLPDSITAPAYTISADNPKRLTTQATFLDVIIATFPFTFLHDANLRADHPRIFMRMREVLKELYKRFASGHVSHYPNGEDFTYAFANALLGGGISEEYKNHFSSAPNDEIPTPIQVWQAYQEQCLSDDGPLFKEMLLEIAATEPARRVNGIRQGWYQNSKHSGKAWELTHYLKVAFRYHVFCVTQKGYIGLAPIGTRKDTDAIAFIDGLKVPFVLREAQEPNWNLVGACYLHGMMDSEAARTDQSIGTRLTFHIV